MSRTFNHAEDTFLMGTAGKFSKGYILLRLGKLCGVHICSGAHAVA